MDVLWRSTEVIPAGYLKGDRQITVIKRVLKASPPQGLMNYMVRGWSLNAFSMERQRIKQGTWEEKNTGEETL